jgi:signal transduction histidine kinase
MCGLPSLLTITIQPKWYQNKWFRIFLLGLIILIFFLLYCYRLDQLQKRQQIRKDIASDLHDDIGSSLNSVKVFLHLARTDTNGEQHLHHIEDSLTEAALGLRDMIWVLDDSQDSAGDLLERIKKFAMPVALASRMTVDCRIESDRHEVRLGKTEKRNLLLIAKEAINNSIKYSGATSLRIGLLVMGHHRTLIIQDNGKGFDQSSATEGHGIKNLQYRAHQIGYRIRIESAAGSGVTIRVDSR